MDGLGTSLDKRQAELVGLSEAQRQRRNSLQQLNLHVRALQADLIRPCSPAREGPIGIRELGGGGGWTLSPRGRILEQRALPLTQGGSNRVPFRGNVPWKWWLQPLGRQQRGRWWQPLERDLLMLPGCHRLHGNCMRRLLWGKPQCVCPSARGRPE